MTKKATLIVGHGSRYEYNKKIMPLGIVMDERICTGHEYALFWQTLRRYLKHPELTENGAEERAEMPEAVEA